MDAQDWAGRSANKTHVECLPWWDPQGHIRNEGGWCSSKLVTRDSKGVEVVQAWLQILENSGCFPRRMGINPISTYLYGLLQDITG